VLDGDFQAQWEIRRELPSLTREHRGGEKVRKPMQKFLLHPIKRTKNEKTSKRKK